MTLFLIFAASVLAGSAFFVGLEFGALRERAEWEDHLSLPPPADEEIPQLPEHAASAGPYRTPGQPLALPPARRPGLFSSTPEFGLTDMFKHSRHYGAGLDIYMANNSEMVAQVDMVRAMNELQKYLLARQRFQSKPDELQQLFLAIVRERNSQNDVKIILAYLQDRSYTYSFHYTLVWALGEVWPPNGKVLRQLNSDKSYGQLQPGNNMDAEKRIREKAAEIIDRWKERDEVAVTVAMCE